MLNDLKRFDRRTRNICTINSFPDRSSYLCLSLDVLICLHAVVLRRKCSFTFCLVRFYDAGLLIPTTAAPLVERHPVIKPWRRLPCPLTTITATWATICRHLSLHTPPVTPQTAPPLAPRSHRSTTSTSARARTTSILQRPRQMPLATQWRFQHTGTWLTVISGRRLPETSGMAA